MSKLNDFLSHQFCSDEMNKFFCSYVEAIYFTETGDDYQPTANAELSDDYLRESFADCRKFLNEYYHLIVDIEEQAAHDLWLTRNRHGTGFWDRSEIYGEQLAEELTRVSHIFGETYPEFDCDKSCT